VSHRSVAIFQNISVLVWKLCFFGGGGGSTCQPVSVQPQREREKRCATLSLKRSAGVWERKGKQTFWSLGGDLSSLLSRTRRGGRTSPWPSGGFPSNLRAPAPPDDHIRRVMATQKKNERPIVRSVGCWYHRVTPVVAENHDVDGTGVVGDTDASLLGFVFPVEEEDRRTLDGVRDRAALKGGGAPLPVVIVDGGREPSSADPVAHHVDPFAEPELHPEHTRLEGNPLHF